MPELPEVESIRVYLHSYIIGKTIEGIEVANKNSFVGAIADVMGSTVIETSRKGKVLNLKLDNKKYIAIHLKGDYDKQPFFYLLML